MFPDSGGTLFSDTGGQVEPDFQTPVEYKTVFPLRHSEILTGAGVPRAFARVSRYSFVVAIACRCVCRRSGATWCNLMQKSTTHRFFLSGLRCT